MNTVEEVFSHRVTGKRFALLMNVSVDSGKAKQSNKFYALLEQSNGTIKIVRGRIDHTVVIEPKTPSIHEWDSIIRKKTQRSSDAYTDVTHLFQETATAAVKNNPAATLSDIQNLVVKKLFDDLQSYAKGSVKANYTISSDKVTEAMVNEAQSILDEIAKDIKIGGKASVINHLLQKLFMVIPRRMSNVKDHLVPSDIKTKADLEALTKKHENEQLTLDVMAGQVAQLKAEKKLAEGVEDKKTKKEVTTLLQVLGLECEVVEDKKELEVIMEMLNDLKRRGQQDNRKIFKRAFRVTNKRTQAAFDANLKTATNKQCLLLWHGSRNANYLSIAEKGLMIRPTGAGYNGSAFGDGIYFAQHSGKSLNYSDFRGSYRSYTGGNSNQAFLLLFNVNVGKQKVVNNCGNYNLRDLRKEGYDSTWAKASSTSYIAYDEYIIYQAQQCTIQYLIEIEG